jgi:hypothetical protein
VRAVNWDNQIGLLGYDLDRTRFKPGETIHLTLYYGTSSQLGDGSSSAGHLDAGHPDAHYTVFVQLLGPRNVASGGPLWAQDDSEPCRRGYRTGFWGPNEIVVDHYAVTIPTEAPAGDFEIAMGFYEWQTLQRLPVLDANGQVVADHVILASVRVTREG